MGFAGSRVGDSLAPRQYPPTHQCTRPFTHPPHRRAHFQIGGQIAPLLASRGTFSDEAIERFAAGLFALVGLAFALKAVTG